MIILTNYHIIIMCFSSFRHTYCTNPSKTWLLNENTLFIGTTESQPTLVTKPNKQMLHWLQLTVNLWPPEQLLVDVSLTKPKLRIKWQTVIGHTIPQEHRSRNITSLTCVNFIWKESRAGTKAFMTLQGQHMLVAMLLLRIINFKTFL